MGAPVAAVQHPDPVAYLLQTAPKRLRGQVVPPRTSGKPLNDTVGIVQANMVRIGWYLSPLGVVLGVIGFVLWWRRGLNQASWLFLAIGLITTVFFIRQTYGSGNQTYIYILRRYVPQVYPTFCLAIAYALVALARLTSNQERTATNLGRHSSLIERLSVIAAGGLLLALVGFSVTTNRAIYRHVEYQGALAQLETIAGQFSPRDVLLFRGGDHIYEAARDTPDVVVTPLKYAFGLNAFTIKSEEPGHYADAIARYIQRWQSEGRQVYMVVGASGAVGLPNMQLVPVGKMALHLHEFEQLTIQKPSNVQDFGLDFKVYRLSSPAQPAPSTVAVDDYAAQVRGFYHTEQIGTMDLAWTDSDALLRLPWPQANTPQTLTINLAGGKRPASLGPARVCLSIRPEMSFWVEDPKPRVGFSEPLTCFSVSEKMTSYTFRFDPRQFPTPTTGTFLLRMKSPAWVPAETQIDPPSNDQRSLGIQFGGLDLVQP